VGRSSYKDPLNICKYYLYVIVWGQLLVILWWLFCVVYQMGYPANGEKDFNLAKKLCKYILKAPFT
jgi:hypothetical protein